MLLTFRKKVKRLHIIHLRSHCDIQTLKYLDRITATTPAPSPKENTQKFLSRGLKINKVLSSNQENDNLFYA